MRFVFRTDASVLMGTGHVMRCLTLAEELIKNGDEVAFISRAHEGNLNGLISKKAIKLFELPQPQILELSSNKIENNNYKKMLGVSQQQDAKESKMFLREMKPDWLIVDHYGLDEIWENAMRIQVKKIMVIDDLANRNHDCDLLLDHNWFENKNLRYRGLVPKACVKLLGPEYALLRKEFAHERQMLKPRDEEKIKRIFVFFGGSDPHGLTKMTLRTLCESEFSHLETDVVIGQNNPQKNVIKKLCLNRPLTHLHIQVDNIASIMSRADLAIATGGVNVWERMSLNLFSLVVITANNQQSTILELHKNGFVLLLGTYKDISSTIIKNALILKIEQNKKPILSKLNVDGIGLSKVINTINSGLING